MSKLDSKSPNKLKILKIAIKKVKNWYLLPLVYFGFFKKEFFYLKTKNGLKIKLRTDSTDIHAFVNVWLVEEYNEKKFEIYDDDTIIDIGGHIGLFTLYVSQFCKKGRIFSFEPIKENFELLYENIQYNNIKNVTAINCPVSDKGKTIKIFFDKDDYAAHSFYGKGKSLEMKAISLIEIFEMNKIEKCDLLKLDCEGAEYEILNSLSNRYYKKINKICLEYHNYDKKQNIKNLKEKLTKLNYSVIDKPSTNEMGMLFAYSNN